MVTRHCRRRATYWLLRSPSQTCHAKPKTQINRRWMLPARWVGCLPQAFLKPGKTSLRKVRTPALQQIKERGALPMTIVVISVSTWPLQQYLGFTAGRWLCGQFFEHKADSLIAKFKEAGGTVRVGLMYEQSHRDYLRSGYSHHRLPVMGC